jgi:hypothetical protein
MRHTYIHMHIYRWSLRHHVDICGGGGSRHIACVWYHGVVTRSARRLRRQVHPRLLAHDVQDKVFLLPHLASAAQETRVAMTERMLANARAVVWGSGGERPRDSGALAPAPAPLSPPPPPSLPPS